MTVATAMTRSEVSGVLAAEAVWNALAGPLEAAAQALAEAERAELHEALNTDPLAFWQDGPGRACPGQAGPGQAGTVQTGRLRRLRDQVTAVTGQAAVSQQAAVAQQDFEEAELSLQALVGRRDELRGLLGAYRAKAAALGAGEDLGLSERYRRARDLLWTAPCDLPAADQAVRDYQQAVLALGQRPGGQQVQP